LPRPVRPVPDETVESYLGRLAAANHVSTRDLAAHLGTRPSTVVPVAVLATVGRQPAAVLARALPQLRDPAGPDLTERQVRLLCRCCAAARGITTPVLVWSRPQDKICLRHRLWTGDAVTTAADQLDLAAHPDVIHAQIRQHRLVRRLGPHTIEAAYQCAREAWLDVTWRGYQQPYRSVRSLRPAGADPPWRIHTEDPAYQAANYPETLTLAGLLAQPRWRHLAMSDIDRDIDRFHTELCRRLPPNNPITPVRLHNLRVLVRHAAQQAGWSTPPSHSMGFP
jgi:hypothetical protein